MPKKIKQSYSKNKLEENREFLIQNIKQILYKVLLNSFINGSTFIAKTIF